MYIKVQNNFFSTQCVVFLNLFYIHTAQRQQKQTLDEIFTQLNFRFKIYGRHLFAINQYEEKFYFRFHLIFLKISLNFPVEDNLETFLYLFNRAIEDRIVTPSLY